MCRIFGYIGGKNIHLETIKKVSDLQLHGGPDSQDFIKQDHWALGNNRLAIQGLDGGHQPFHLDNKIFCVFNGEIYNYKELKEFLMQNGYHFDDTCDGSIILPLYHMYGIEFASKLDGMFSIAILDTREKNKLVIATDPTGIKSVYYQWDNKTKTLMFSSELPALLAFDDQKKTIRTNAIDDYLTGKAIWGPETIYNEIFTLEPSMILIAPFEEEPKTLKYSSTLNSELPIADIEESGKYLDAIFQKEVSVLMTADVPICAVTSGGLDSSYVTALASQFTDNLHTFNIWYEGNWPNDERHFAKQVSQQYNTTHHQVLVKETDFVDLIHRMNKHIGQPNSAPHCLSTYALFEEINKYGFKVALTGEGADEFFGGYARFAKAAFDENQNWLVNYLDKLSAVSKSQRDRLYSREYLHHLKPTVTLYEKTIERILTKEKNCNNRLTALLDFDQYDRFPYYILRRVDHLSMAHSVEVRVPFCQPRIAALSKAIPNKFKINNNQGKAILYSAARGKLPESIMDRPKQPFLLPISAMLRKEHPLFELLIDTVNSHEFLNRNIYDQVEINNLIKKQLVKPSDEYAEPLWALMMFELWLHNNESNLSYNI